MHRSATAEEGGDMCLADALACDGSEALFRGRQVYPGDREYVPAPDRQPEECRLRHPGREGDEVARHVLDLQEPDEGHGGDVPEHDQLGLRRREHGAGGDRGHGERSRLQLHFKFGGAEDLSILAVNALAVNVLAVDSVA